MKYEERWYQTECADAMWDVVVMKPDLHPVVAVPTGGGKTIIMGLFIKKYLETYPDNQVMVLSHTQDILQQDHEALQEFFPEEEIGMYSAGLGEKNICQITVAGIQSIYRHPDLCKWINLFLVDEVHTVNHKSQGMYRTLLDDHGAIKCGMSATCYRTGHGMIYEGKKTLFNHLAYDLTSKDNFNRLVDEGYLTKLISVSPDMKMNAAGIKKSGGDYNIKHLAQTFDRDHITDQAVEETIKYGKNYKKWLIFAIDIDHADHICERLNNAGIASDVLHSRMSRDREEVVKDFKSGDTRALVSVGMVTTGFDAPNVDLLVLLRPTMSALLHVQMVGRGLRIAPNKEHCLVLDFAGNTMRLGPINNVRKPTKAGDGTGEAPTKICPECSTILFAAARECDICGLQFEFQVKLTTTADDTAIVEKGKQEKKVKWMEIQNIQYTIHRKPNSPDSMLIIYHCGLQRIKDWVCLNHKGWVRDKAIQWAKFRGHSGSFDTYSVFNNRKALREPTAVLVDFTNRYPQVINARF